MAGIYSPKNVGKLIFGGPLASEGTIADFRASATVGDIDIVGANGGGPERGKPFKVVKKNNDSLTGVNASESIDPSKITGIKVSKFKEATQKSVEVTGFTGTVLQDVTYRVSIRKYDHIQSPENFRHIHGFAVTGTNVGTYADVLAEIKANLDSALLRENSLAEFDIVAGADKLLITAKDTAYAQGRNQGDLINFDVEVSVKDNSPSTLSSDAYNNVLAVNVIEGGDPGQGTFKQVANLEYFLNGYETADYGREVGYPANFTFNSQASNQGEYNTIQIAYFSERTSVNVERQHRELTIVFNEPGGVTGLTDAFVALLNGTLAADDAVGLLTPMLL